MLKIDFFGSVCRCTRYLKNLQKFFRKKICTCSWYLDWKLGMNKKKIALRILVATGVALTIFLYLFPLLDWLVVQSINQSLMKGETSPFLVVRQTPEGGCTASVDTRLPFIIAMSISVVGGVAFDQKVTKRRGMDPVLIILLLTAAATAVATAVNAFSSKSNSFCGVTCPQMCQRTYPLSCNGWLQQCNCAP